MSTQPLPPHDAAAGDGDFLAVPPAPLPRTQPAEEAVTSAEPVPAPPDVTPPPVALPAGPGQSARRATHKILLRICAAAVAGLLLVGAGFAAGRQTRGAPPRTSPTAAPTELGSYAERQRTVNITSLPPGELSEFARTWMASVADCRAQTDPGGPALADGEQARVQCDAGLAALYLVSYRTLADKDKARARHVDQAAASASLAPQAAPPTQRHTASGNSSGWYIEYAYKIAAGDRAGDIVASVWWDNSQNLTAGYLVAYWNDDLAARWDPLRDLWLRHT